MMLLQLLALHALCDFPLQGDFMARAKNHKTPIPGVPWSFVLLAHALIHAGAVSLVAPLWCAVVEFFAHYALDYAKNEGWLGKGEHAFSNDQLGHVLCKLAYWGLA
jgi:Protein of unknown function (DUF3307)